MRTRSGALALAMSIGACAAVAQTASPGFPVPPVSSAPVVRVRSIAEVDVERIRAAPRFEPMPIAVATYAANLVVVEGSEWSVETATAALADAAWTLAQCGLRLRRATVRVIDLPQRFQAFYPPASRLVAGRLRLDPPMIVFVKDTLAEPPFAAESFGRTNARAWPELAGSVWLTRHAAEPGLALGHELVHVLADSTAHSRTPGNLMNAEVTRGTTALDPAQCSAMLEAGVRDNWIIKLPN